SRAQGGLREHDAWRPRALWLPLLGSRRALALAAAFAVGVATLGLWPKDELRYAVDGAQGGQAGYVLAPADREAHLRFTEGSLVALSPGSSLRVAEVASMGARLLLEDGHASLRITHRSSAKWSVDAGPFTILVAGTA